MSIQSKFSGGLYKIQDTLNKNKVKVEITGETDKLMKILDDATIKKSNKILELGIAIYNQRRIGNLNEDEIQDICKSIVGFDHIIYNVNQKIEELQKTGSGIICEKCSNELSKDSKFCSVCGSKVELKDYEIEYITCTVCEIKILKENNYCPCCGSKVSV